MYPSKNERFLRAAWREPVDATPIWIMRQAGRYLPEYRELRARAGSFLKLCKTPELACEVTLQPLKRFDLDAAILFSDILTIPDAMGLGLQFKEGEGPVFEHIIQSARDVDSIVIPDPETDLKYVLDAIKFIQRDLAGKIPLIGFCGSPWTLAAYMTQGHGHSDFPIIQKMLIEQPRVLHALLEKLAEAIAQHLNAQIRAGVNTVMVFDTWGGLLNDSSYREFSLRHTQTIFEKLIREHAGQRIPRILFTKNGSQWLTVMSQSGCDVLGIDWLMDMDAARKITQNKVALQGNMNPEFLYQSEAVIEKEVARILKAYGHGSGHIFNLGHGIPQDVDPGKVEFVIECVHRLSQPYHANSKEPGI